MKIRSKERRLNRLPEYDYSQSGYYYVTLCTKGKISYFGRVVNENMSLSKIGDIAKSRWQEIPSHYENVRIDQFIVMPNHIHGIIIIDSGDIVGTEQCSVPTDNAAKTDSEYKRTYGLLSQVIKSFKEAVTKQVRLTEDYRDFAWQRSFYDHVIRNEVALSKIREYVLLNPAKWEIDEYNPEDRRVQNDNYIATRTKGK